MSTHGRTMFRLRPWALINLIVTSTVWLFVAWAPVPVAAQGIRCDQPDNIWRSLDSEADWHVDSLGGDIVEGTFVLGKEIRKLRGRLTADGIAGDWIVEGKPNASGNFVFILLPDKRHLQIDFFQNGKNIESSKWSCEPPPKPTPVVSPTPELVDTKVVTPDKRASQSPTPFFSPKADAEGRDTDQFKTFDALPKAKQEKSLFKKGPRLPKSYDTSDWSLRMFVRSGWPVMLDYGLDSNSVAEVSISVDGIEPLIIKVKPAPRAQIRITIPERFGSRQVGKLRLTAVSNSKKPASFHLYGIGMGESGVQALWKMSPQEPYRLVAMAGLVSDRMPGDEQRSLFRPEFTGDPFGTDISVDPTKINSREKPVRVIGFNYTFHSAFSDGQWELWRESGLDSLQVWHKRTGSISPSQTKSQRWNGRTASPKGFSLGTHSIQLTAWHGKKGDGSSVIVRTAPNIVVE